MSPSRNKRTLLIEDDTIFGEFLKRFLTQRGYQVTHVTDANDVLPTLEQQSVDFVICDIGLPGFPGHRLYQQLRLQLPDLCSRFLFITGNAITPELDEFLRTHRVPILQKPFHINQLFSLLTELAGAENTSPGP